MADKKISQLTAATTPLDGTEVLPIVQSSATVKVANNDLRPKQIQSNATSGVHQIVGPAAGTTRVMTVPDANFTAARTDAAQSFTGTQTFNNDVNTGTLTSTVNQNGVTFTSVFNSNNASGNGAGFQTGKSAADPWIRVWGDHNSGNLYYDTVLTFDKIFRRNMTTTPVNQFKIGGDDNLYPMQAAKGINFTANTPAAGMTSQLLNWYEEGTWTPTITGSTTDPTVTYNTQYGRYTRIGRQVTILGFVQITAVTVAGSGYARISGLPFQNNFTETPGNVGYCSMFTATSSPLILAVRQNETNLYFYSTATADARSGLTVNPNVSTDLVAGYVWFSATYFT